MNTVRAYFAIKRLGAIIVLAGFMLCTIHVEAASENLSSAHHSAPHTAQCVDTCIDHVPAVPTIHARSATTVTPDTPYIGQAAHLVVLPRAVESAVLLETAHTARGLSKLYLHYSVLRV